jgi:hypothetical protein
MTSSWCFAFMVTTVVFWLANGLAQALPFANRQG